MDEADPNQFKEETQSEKDERWGNPDMCVSKLFDECNASKYYTKMVEELDITDELFWTMNKKELMDTLGIETWGTKTRLFMRREKVLEKHKEECEKADLDKKTKRLTSADKENIKKLLSWWLLIHVFNNNK